MSNNLVIWNQVKQVPNNFLKTIQFGYLKGKSDINPQWRLMAMTQAFGMVGHGWSYRIINKWTETSPCGTVMAFVEVAVKTKHNGEWGEEFTGLGGSQIVELAKGNLKANDEGYKMALTDALGVAFKSIGVAADIYFGNYDGSKYVSSCEKAFESQEDKAKQLQESFNQALAFIDNVVDVNQLGAVYKRFANTEYQEQIKDACANRKAQLTA